ncbi:hypothetical protein GALMADRAFT_766425 [Galerina marginata CBS 339.88]|uniref:Uncharacterized protein n=1 Tax=Galerina marginata (strain CBS 339.88) TaxID=685588 RepID=A0A067SQA4_GALM3|nr:hypothetical protein GALMADRAFT_766425 [Galerina marginata CBS 339.88]
MASQVNAEGGGLGYANQCRRCMRKQNFIRKLGKLLSGNMNTQNALETVVGVMNRLAYYRCCTTKSPYSPYC